MDRVVDKYRELAYVLQVAAKRIEQGKFTREGLRDFNELVARGVDDVRAWVDPELDVGPQPPRLLCNGLIATNTHWSQDGYMFHPVTGQPNGDSRDCGHGIFLAGEYISFDGNTWHPRPASPTGGRHTRAGADGWVYVSLPTSIMATNDGQTWHTVEYPYSDVENVRIRTMVHGVHRGWSAVWVIGRMREHEGFVLLLRGGRCVEAFKQGNFTPLDLTDGWLHCRRVNGQWFDGDGNRLDHEPAKLKRPDHLGQVSCLETWRDKAYAIIDGELWTFTDADGTWTKQPEAGCDLERVAVAGDHVYVRRGDKWCHI